MKPALFLILFFLSLPAFAEILEVHSAAKHLVQKNTWIVKLMDGRVGFWSAEEDPTLDPYTLPHAIIDATLSEDHILTGIRLIGYLEATADLPAEKILPDPRYSPTVYPTYQYATDILRSMRRGWKNDSQCYDKSHVWAYEEAYYGRYLQKVFLFFSDAYIARYNYPWWFHTAPYALVRLNGEVVERVMDPTFVTFPAKMKIWTDLFMKNKAACKLVEKYTDYSGHPGEDDCYLMKASIYFWQPKDLEAYERSGVEKTKFIDWEIRHAYQNGFGIRL